VLGQAPALGEVGAGIQTSANASRVFHGLGLADQLDRISGGTTTKYIACFEEGEWSEESLTRKAPWSELRQESTGWHDDVHEPLEATDRDECYKWALNSRTPTGA